MIINQPPPPSIMDRPLVGQHHHGNFPSQIADLMSEQFVFDSIFCTGTTHGIETALGLTTINSVTGAQNCSRVLNARRLTGIANLIVPKIELFMKSWAGLDYLTRAIRREFSFPVIIRSIHQQHSPSAFFVASESELASAIENINEDAFYCIQFVETLHFNRFRHRLRAAVVDGEVFIIAADFAHSWDARGARRSIESSAYTQRPDLLQLANDQILHPENHFGSSVFTTLRQIAERIPLDIFGIDFDVNSDGNLIFFEANATMKLLSWANVYPTPAEIDARVRESITKAFLKRY